MRKNIVSICVLALLLVTFSVFGQEDRNKGIINSALIGLEYEVKAGFNIGGTAPIPLPVEIRDITGYNPTMAVAIEGNVTKWFDQEKKWGMRIGIRLDSKGMKTNANVKNYGMEIIGEGGERIKGNLNPAKRKAMAVKNEKRFLKQKRNALKNPGYSRHPVKTQASFKRLLKAV